VFVLHLNTASPDSITLHLATQTSMFIGFCETIYHLAGASFGWASLLEASGLANYYTLTT